MASFQLSRPEFFSLSGVQFDIRKRVSGGEVESGSGTPRQTVNGAVSVITRSLLRN